jgi:hypothetical protein
MSYLKGFVMSTSKLRLSLSALAISLSTTAWSGELSEARVDTGAADRIEAAALLQVYSQETASAACHMANDVRFDEAKELMLEAKTKFSIVLDALEFGNTDMHILEPETRRKTLVKIQSLRENWQPVLDAAIVLLDNPSDESALKVIKANNEAILDQANLLTGELEAQYANPAELMQSDVMLLEFAARQAVLTQKMAKVSCEIWVGNRSEDRIAKLTDSMNTYEATLDALLNGMPALGLQAAPTPQIRDALLEASTHWKKTKSELQVVLSGDGVTEEIKSELFHDLNLAMRDMQTIEHLYVKFSKHGIEGEADT